MTSAGDANTLPMATDNLRHFCTLRKSNLNGDANDRHLRTEGTSTSSSGNSSADADRIGRFCTNFCEKSLEQQQQGEDGETAGSESIENFCTLRKKRQQKPAAGSESSEVHETSLMDGHGSTSGAGVGGYCTLKKKKLKLNQRFVESFLEDPNAKLHDYLSELDAYLDEIDGLDSYGEDDDEDEAAATKEESSVDSEPEVTGEGAAVEDVVFKKCEDQISYIDVKNFCTPPKKKRVQFLRFQSWWPSEEDL
ncbi:hypothetical protein quinque_015863 [Culex quinquefasciatus]